MAQVDPLKIASRRELMAMGTAEAAIELRERADRVAAARRVIARMKKRTGE